MENIRGKEDTVSLDTAGFQFYTIPSKYKGEFSDDEVNRKYHPDTEELLKKVTDASKIVLFDHRIDVAVLYSEYSRPAIPRHVPGTIDNSPDKPQRVMQAHVDQTVAASVARVHRHLPPNEAPELLKRRFQIINVWRPIGVPALESPLVLCDFRSVDTNNDGFPVAIIYPENQEWMDTLSTMP